MAQQRESLGLPATLAAAIDGAFVGRESELSLLARAFSEAKAGSRRGALIRGEPGVGKTRLAAEMAARTVDAGAWVVHGRCSEDLDVPYQPLVEALGELVAAAPMDVLEAHVRVFGSDLLRLVPSMAERIADISVPSQPGSVDARHRLFEAVADLFARVSRKRPLVLVIDDLHWATVPTVLMLRHLIRSNRPMALLVLATYRETDLLWNDELSHALGGLSTEAGVARVVLDGLAADEVGSFIEVRTGRALDDTAAEQLTGVLSDETRGNPFYLAEILNHLVETGALYQRDAQWTSSVGTTAELQLPDSVVDVVAQRLRRLSPPAYRVLTLASVLESGFHAQLLEAALGVDAGDESVLAALDEAQRAGLMIEAGGRYAFAHALTRHTVYAGLSTLRRCRLHRRAGEALEKVRGGEHNLQALAYHFAEAALEPDVATKAASYNLRAGKQAVLGLAFDEATAHFERGLAAVELAALPDPRPRAELLLALGDARLRLSDEVGMRAAANQAAAMARDADEPELLAQAALIHMHWSDTGHPNPEGVELCEEALYRLGVGNLGLRAQLLARLADHSLNAEGDRATAEELVTEAVRIGAGDPDGLACALHARCLVLLGTNRARELIHTAEDLLALGRARADLLDQAEALGSRSTARLTLGDRAGFEADSQAVADLGVSRPLRGWHRTTLAILDGRFADAEVAAAETLEMVSPPTTNILNAYSAQLFQIRREQGRVEELLPLVEQFTAENPGLPTFRAAYATGLCDVGRLDEAGHVFETLLSDGLDRFPRDQTWTTALALLAETAATLGDSDRAAPLVDALQPFAGQTVVLAYGVGCAGSVDRFLGMLATTVGRPHDAVRLIESALALDRRLGSRPLQARTRYWLAHALLARGGDEDGRRAQLMLGDSIVAATQLGMRALQTQAEALLPSAWV